MLTSIKPHSMNATVLHPTVRRLLLVRDTMTYACHTQQKRVLTVRECARAQGFHDGHQFLSVHTIPAKIVEDVSVGVGPV